MPTLAEKLVKEFENLQASRPYVPYGAGVKKKVDELLAKARKGKREEGKPWNFKKQFSDDELRLIISDPQFASQILKEFDPSFKSHNPNQQDINDFRSLVAKDEGDRVYPTMKLRALSHPDFYPSVGEQNAINLQKANVLRGSLESRIKENPQLEKQAETLLKQSDRLAPLSPLHERAKSLLQRNNAKSLGLASKEIAAAGKENIPRSIEPYLKSSSQPMDKYIERYEKSYQPLIDNFRAEARKDFLENDLPRINNQYASRGAFHGSARERALDKARRDKEQRIEREIARLKTQARQEAEKNFHTERGHYLRQAEVKGHAHESERTGRLQTAESLRANNAMAQATLHQQASALSQMGRTEQQQRQNELNIPFQEYQAEMRRPQEELLNKASIASGAPQMKPQNSPDSFNPEAPNAYNFASGMLGHMLGSAGQQQARLATGGLVRKGYAAGDSVSRAAAQLQQMANHVQEDPEQAEMRNSAQAFKNHNSNPMADYLFTLGSHQLANPTGSPLQNFGQGSLLGMQAYKQAQSSNLTAQEKYNNLMSKIHDTKMNQREFLAKHHASMLQQEEMSRHHQAQEGETRRGHDIMQQHYKDMMEEKKNKLALMHEMSREKLQLEGNKPLKKTSTQQKLEEKALSNIIENSEIKNDLSEMEKALQNVSWLGTGPNIGRFKNKFGIDNDINLIGNNIVTKVNKLWGRGAGSNMQLQTLKGGKPGIENSKEANEISIRRFRDESDRRINKEIGYLLKAGWSPQEIRSLSGIEPSEEMLKGLGMLDESGKTDETPEGGVESQESNVSDMVEMRTPDGEKSMIPRNKVQEAIAAGGKLVQ